MDSIKQNLVIVGTFLQKRSPKSIVDCASVLILKQVTKPLILLEAIEC